MITCKDAVASLWEYLDQHLERESQTDLEEHLGLCRHCCGELDFAKQLRDLLQRPAPASELTPDVRSRLEAFVKDLGQKE